MMKNPLIEKKSFTYKAVVITSINVILLLLSLNLLAGTLGFFASPLLSRMAAFYLLLGIALLNIPLIKIATRRKQEFETFLPSNLTVGFLLMLGGLIVLLLFDEMELWLMSLPIVIFGLDLFLQGIGKIKGELFVLFITSISYGLFVIYLQNIPSLWLVLQKISLGFSGIIGHLTASVSVGPSASGMWILLIFLIFSLTLFFFSETAKRKNLKLFIGVVLGLIIGWILYLIILALHPIRTDESVLNSQYIFFIFGLVPILFFITKSKIKEGRMVIPSFKAITKKKNTTKWEALALVILLIFSGLILTTFLNSASDKGEVMIYQPGLGDFAVPEYGKYGYGSAGFFGLLPQVLNASGFRTTILNGTITKERLDDTDVFVVISLNEALTSQEHTTLWNFVAAGGSLLVIGDHTNISGIMDPLNRLLEPVAIRFRFDSAKPVHEVWKSCYHLLHHPITETIEDDQITISIGASLDISSSAFPIVIGKHSYSDWGTYEDPEKVYLGDYHYNPGEQIGDLILVAGAYYGEGKVVVFGDTSPFQNGNLPYSYSFVDNVFIWLTNTRTTQLYIAQIGLSLLSLVAALVIFKKARKKLLLIILPVAFCISLIVTASVNPILLGEKQLTGAIAYIDFTHGENFDLKAYTDNSVDGLALNIMRNNYLCVVLREFSREKIMDSEILIFVTPTEPFDQEEVDDIKAFVSSGGLLILSTGYTYKEALQPLLRDFGFDIINAPLGPVPYIERDLEEHLMEPRFVDSWPIHFITNDSESFFSVQIGEKTYDLVAFKTYGNGGVLLIADGEFLLNKNLESLYDYWPGNIKFLKDVFDAIQERGVLP